MTRRSVRHSVHFNFGDNAHRHELLKEEFACIGQKDLHHVGVVAVDLTVEMVLSEIGDGKKAGFLADVDTIGVGLIEEALFEKGGAAMADNAVAFHLAETQTAFTGSTFDRLSCQNLHRASSS